MGGATHSELPSRMARNKIVVCRSLGREEGVEGEGEGEEGRKRRRRRGRKLGRGLTCCYTHSLDDVLSSGGRGQWREANRGLHHH